MMTNIKPPTTFNRNNFYRHRIIFRKWDCRLHVPMRVEYDGPVWIEGTGFLGGLFGPRFQELSRANCPRHEWKRLWRWVELAMQNQAYDYALKTQGRDAMLGAIPGDFKISRPQ